MSQPKSPFAQAAARKLLDTAVSQPHGIRVNMGSPARAFSMTMSCRNVIKQQKALNKRIYAEDDPQANITPWDGLLIRNDGPWVEIIPGEDLTFEIYALDASGKPAEQIEAAREKPEPSAEPPALSDLDLDPEGPVF